MTILTGFNTKPRRNYADGLQDGYRNDKNYGGRFAALLQDAATDLTDGKDDCTTNMTTCTNNLKDCNSGAYADPTSTAEDRVPDARLCAVCQWKFYGIQGRKLLKLPKIIDVYKSAKKGCMACRVIKDGLEINDGQKLLAAALTVGTVEARVRCSWIDFGNGLLVRWYHGARGALWCILHLYATTRLPKVPLISAKIGHIRRSLEERNSTSILSEATLGLAFAWLDFCITSHEECRSSLVRQRILPTRLLKIGPKAVRLCEGSTLPNDTYYMTLSHRWGKSNMIKLSSDSTLLRGGHLLVSELTATFQTAIRICRRLRCKYIWIDSLCIIQDSASDKLKECARMWEVYGNSYCTIAATSATGANDGLFHKESNGGPVPCKISKFMRENANIRTTNGSLPEKQVRNAIGGHLLPAAELSRTIDYAPLCRRGWVTQERLLSPRILHFCSDQVWWECRCHFASETYPEGYPGKTNGTKISWDPVKIWKSGSVGQCYEAWQWCVKYYSKCDLSYPEDRLVAIGGVARQIGEALRRLGASGKYLAGLWEKNFAYDLLWSRQPGNARPVQNTERGAAVYIAPSWSWASFDFSVEYNLLDAVAKGLVRTALVSSTLNTSEDGFTTLSGGFIRLRGPLFRTVLDGTDEGGRRAVDEAVNYDDWAQRTSKMIFPGINDDPTRPHAFSIEVEVSIDREEDDRCAEVYALIVVDVDEGSFRRYHGLLLRDDTAQRECPSHHERVLRRIGVFKVYGQALELVSDPCGQCQDLDSVCDTHHSWRISTFCMI